MYAFRKPFTAATYENEFWVGIGFKTILIASQVAGYTASKFAGIKVVSEMPTKYRALGIIVLIAIAELALLLFAMTPAPWNAFWLFVNGLPLGMVFGLVIRFLEGRKTTEALSAGLCASFIFASGFVKSVGRSLIQDYEVNEFWMPVLTGLIFAIPLLGFTWMLAQIPPPSKEEEQQRTRRESMTRQQRWTFFQRHALGLSGLVLIYSMLTIIRSFRDDFSVEIWQDLGIDEPSVFAISEFWVMVFVTVINGALFLVVNNRRAFMLSLGLLTIGFFIVLACIWGQQWNIISPMTFMVGLGLGLYIPYVAIHTTVFERLIAVFGDVATLGYLMYLADALGYMIYVFYLAFINFASAKGSLLAHELATPDLQPQTSGFFLNLLFWISLVTSVASIGISVSLFAYYAKRLRHLTPSQDTPPPAQSN